MYTLTRCTARLEFLLHLVRRLARIRELEFAMAQAAIQRLFSFGKVLPPLEEKKKKEGE